MRKEFRIVKREYENRTYRIPKDLLEEVGIAASKAGVSANEFVVQALEFALSNLVIDENGDKL